MSCSVCNGHIACPCCSPEPNMVQCPECNGTGYAFYDEEGEEISAEHYNQLPPDKRDIETCDYCEDTGEIEFDYEPDYDDYNE